MSDPTDVLVIGGGVVGLSAAHFLAERGRRVTVIERQRVGSGASEGNAGMVCPSELIPLSAPGVIVQALKWMLDSRSPFYIKPRLDPALLRWTWRFARSCNAAHVRRTVPLLSKLHLRSRELYEQFSERPGFDFDYHQRGLLKLAITKHGLEHCRSHAAIAREAGLDVHDLDTEQAQARAEGLELSSLGGVYFADDAHLTPLRFLDCLAADLEQRGVVIHRETEALGFTRAAGRIESVQTTRGAFAVQEVVLAAGSWSPPFARELGLKLPIQPAKGYSIMVPRPDGYPEQAIQFQEAKVIVTPMGDRVRFAGTLELAGMNERINPRRVQAILDAVPRYLPTVQPRQLETLHVWRGLRPCSPDGVPFVGRAPKCENVTIAAGHAMIGMSLGPVTGELVGQIVCGETPEIDLEMLRPDRFASVIA